MTPPTYSDRLLAIDLSARGFGFVVFDGDGRLVDWGRHHPRKDMNDACLARVVRLLDQYDPGLLVLENCDHASSRKRARVKMLSAEIARLAGLTIKVVRIPWSVVRGVCGSSPKATREDVVDAVARTFPILAGRRPRRRKFYDPEDRRMDVFDAAALGLTACVVAGRIPKV